MYSIDVYKVTTDDWHPSFKLEDGTALVQAGMNFVEDGFMVGVSGVMMIAWVNSLNQKPKPFVVLHKSLGLVM